MDSRRYSAVVVAYRRGYIKPYYEHGVQSYLREKVLIDTCEAELIAQHAHSRLALNIAAYAPHYDPKRLYLVKDSINEVLDFVNASNSCQLYRPKPEVVLSESAKLMKQFKDMVASGEVAKFAQECQEIENKLQSTN